MDRELIADLIVRSALLLDEESFEEWTGLFAAEGTYEISAYSPEIRRGMVWQRSCRSELQKLLNEVREHVRDSAKRTHMLSAPLLSVEADRARATSAFCVYRTNLDGQTTLYAVGRYEDELIKQTDDWVFFHRKVTMDTRMLDTFTHIPI